MTTLDPTRLHTVQLVPVTAFDRDGRLALEPMQKLLQRLLAAGIRVFIPCAGSAEFHALSTDEIVAAVEMTRETVGGQGLVLAPVGGAVERAAELGQRAVAAGADALLVMPLNFPYLCDAGAADYYRYLMARVPCPLMIYKKDPLPSDTLLLALADDPRLLGVKYAVNDIDAFQRVVRASAGRLEWSCGSAERFAPYFLLAGATGYTSGAGNVCPRVTLAMHRELAAGRWTEALQWQQVVAPIEEFRARDGSSYNISFLKYALARTGLDFGAPRPPYRQLTAAECREIDQLLPPILEAEQSLAETPTG